MAHIITSSCTKDMLCVEVCPVDCIYEGADQLFVNTDECIDCGTCEAECQHDSIFEADALPAEYADAVAKNAAFFSSKAPGSEKPVALK